MPFHGRAQGLYARDAVNIGKTFDSPLGIPQMKFHQVKMSWILILFGKSENVRYSQTVLRFFKLGRFAFTISIALMSKKFSFGWSNQGMNQYSPSLAFAISRNRSESSPILVQFISMP